MNMNEKRDKASREYFKDDSSCRFHDMEHFNAGWEARGSEILEIPKFSLTSCSYMAPFLTDELKDKDEVIEGLKEQLSLTKQSEEDYARMVRNMNHRATNKNIELLGKDHKITELKAQLLKETNARAETQDKLLDKDIEIEELKAELYKQREKYQIGHSKAWYNGYDQGTKFGEQSEQSEQINQTPEEVMKRWKETASYWKNKLSVLEAETKTELAAKNKEIEKLKERFDEMPKITLHGRTVWDAKEELRAQDKEIATLKEEKDVFVYKYRESSAALSDATDRLIAQDKEIADLEKILKQKRIEEDIRLMDIRKYIESSIDDIEVTELPDCPRATRNEWNLAKELTVRDKEIEGLKAQFAHETEVLHLCREYGEIKEKRIADLEKKVGSYYGFRDFMADAVKLEETVTKKDKDIVELQQHNRFLEKELSLARMK